MAGGLGFEPRLTESESAVLPLNYPPIGKTLSLSVASGARPVASFFVSWSARCSNVDATPAHLGHLGRLSKRERSGLCVETRDTRCLAIDALSHRGRQTPLTPCAAPTCRKPRPTTPPARRGARRRTPR